MPEPRSLLQKYDIPINHLDFDYVNKCCDAREVEHILVVLKSGQEGHFPALVSCTEKRLTELNPGSRALRTEMPVLDPASVPAAEWQELSQKLEAHFADMQVKDGTLRSAEHEFVDKLPAIRRQDKDTLNDKSPVSKTPSAARIKSCDYAQWDKYDADTELTKMDLSQEQARESSAIRAKRCARPLDEIVCEAEDVTRRIAQMNAIEVAEFVERCRVQGNELFRAGDYADAVGEYTRSLAAQKTAVAFANRAMAYLKLGENQKAITDCDECLRLDGRNIKAHLRKAQALQNDDHHVEAFGVYTNLLRFDANNAVAKEAVRKLRQRMPEYFPPENAKRLQIEANGGDVESAKDKRNTTLADDFAALIVPKKIVPSKFQQMADSLGSVAGNPEAAKNGGTAKNSVGKSELSKSKAVSTRRAEGHIRMEVANNRTEYKNGVVIEEL